MKYTDPGFWKVFDFTFVTGRPFTEADFRSVLPAAVLTERLATRLFGSEDAVEKSVVIDYATYTVTGMVENVSQAAENAFADVWVPYTTNASLMTSVCEGIGGDFRVVMLAPLDVRAFSERLFRESKYPVRRPGKSLEVGREIRNRKNN